MALKHGNNKGVCWVRKDEGVCWVRKDGRLTKMQITAEDDDLAIIAVENEEAIAQLIVQKTVRAKWIVLRGKSHQDWPFLTLPFEVQMMMMDDISTEDVLNLAKTCKIMDEFINKNIVVNVILPLSDENQKRLAGRYVLDLTSTVNLKVWREGEYFEMVKIMNLKKLKRLKFNGSNFALKSDMFRGLSDLYLDCLGHYISSSNHLQSIDFLIDSSARLRDIVNTISKFPTLREVTLRCYDPNDIIQRNIEDHRENPSMTINKLLRHLLEDSFIVKLTLKGFSVTWGFGDNHLVIKSKTLQSLSIEYSKNWEIGYIEAEILKEIDIDDWYSSCLYHSNSEDRDGGFPTKDGMGRLAPVLARGCPALERFNHFSIKELKEIRNGGDWLKELENHKGKGVYCDRQIISGGHIYFDVQKEWRNYTCAWCSRLKKYC